MDVSVNFKCKIVVVYLKGFDLYKIVKRYYINLYDLIKDGIVKEMWWYYLIVDKGNVWLMLGSCMKIEYDIYIGRGI